MSVYLIGMIVTVLAYGIAVGVFHKEIFYSGYQKQFDEDMIAPVIFGGVAVPIFWPIVIVVGILGAIGYGLYRTGVAVRQMLDDTDTSQK